MTGAVAVPIGRTRLLVCAFGPFPGVPANPSERAVRDMLRVRRPALAEADIHLEILPTRWDALARLDALLARHAPDAVLLVGVASRRHRVSVETRAVNATRDFPDAARRHPSGRRLAAGDGELRSTATIPPLLHALRAAGVPAAASREAGRYLCNASFFHALGEAGRRVGRVPPVVFVHLPGRTGRPSRASRAALARGLSGLLVALASQARRAHAS